MSAYGDYKCGAITYQQYCAAMAEEDRRDRYFEEQEAMHKPMICDYCIHYGDVCRNMASPCYGHIVSSEDTCEDWDDESDSET